jgi:hypothetical protein
MLIKSRQSMKPAWHYTAIEYFVAFAQQAGAVSQAQQNSWKLRSRAGNPRGVQAAKAGVMRVRIGDLRLGRWAGIRTQVLAGRIRVVDGAGHERKSLDSVMRSQSDFLGRHLTSYLVRISSWPSGTIRAALPAGSAPCWRAQYMFYWVD